MLLNKPSNSHLSKGGAQ